MNWAPIREFPGYSVSEEGQVRNDDSGHILALTRNQHGIVQVGLMRNGIQYKRAVGLQVAKAFIDRPPFDTFNSVINLNGDRTDNGADNLMWRPRWFSIQYHKQFHNGKRGFDQPIVDVRTGERFPTSWQAATKYGLLDREILIATLNRTYVWPTYQEFRVISD